MNEPARYEFRVRGVVSSRTASAFEEIDMRCDTIVSGVMHDDSALARLLEKIRDHGLEVIDARRVPNEALDSAQRQTRAGR